MEWRAGANVSQFNPIQPDEWREGIEGEGSQRASRRAGQVNLDCLHCRRTDQPVGPVQCDEEHRGKQQPAEVEQQCEVRCSEGRRPAAPSGARLHSGSQGIRPRPHAGCERESSYHEEALRPERIYPRPAHPGPPLALRRLPSLHPGADQGMQPFSSTPLSTHHHYHHHHHQGRQRPHNTLPALPHPHWPAARKVRTQNTGGAAACRCCG